MIKNKSLNCWLKTLETSHNKKIDLGLDRVKSVLRNLKLGKIAPTIITVAGTNGKGSTVAILSSILQQAGYKVGEFTSPHIRVYNERIKVNSQDCHDKVIVSAFEQIESSLNGVTLSYFEYSTLAATSIFKLLEVDVAILEVGLGGRLDSVNAIDTDCAIITTIDIDHTEWLGDTIESIGFEKAGIMRSYKPVIYGGKNCPQSIINYAEKINANLVFVDVPKIVKLNINGRYQQTNARTAITALRQLEHLNVNNNDIAGGLVSVKLQARLQVVSHNPTIIFDVSHNHQAAKELAVWLSENPIEGKTFATFGVLADKEPINWLDQFENTIDVWSITQVDNYRAMPIADLLKVLSSFAKLITSHKNVEMALKATKTMARKEDRIIVFGSFYVVSDAVSSMEIHE